MSSWNQVQELRGAPGGVMSLENVTVTPVLYGWGVESSFNESPLVFLSAAWAEHAGRQLALAAAKSGRFVDMRVYGSDGKLVLRTYFWSNGLSAANQP